MCEALVQHGATVNVEDDDKRTPLFYAVQQVAVTLLRRGSSSFCFRLQGHVETVARLMQLGADRDYRFSNALCAITWACDSVALLPHEDVDAAATGTGTASLPWTAATRT